MDIIIDLLVPESIGPPLYVPPKEGLRVFPFLKKEKKIKSDSRVEPATSPATAKQLCSTND